MFAIPHASLAFIKHERALQVGICVTCRLGLHVSGKLAADAVVVGADVVKTPASELLGTVELSK